MDNLDITLEDGRSASVLTYREYLGLAIQSLREFFIVADIDKSQAAEVMRIQGEAVRIIAQNPSLHPVDFKQCVTDLKALGNQHARHPHYLWTAAKFIERLALSYPIVALVPRPADNRLRTIVKYERSLIPRLLLARFRKSPVRYIKERIGLLFGARPIELDLSLGNATYAASYHVFVYGPEGTYLGFQNVPGLESEFRDARSAYFRFRRRLGQSYLHAYFRSVPPRGSNLRLRVEFFETPPGSVSKASIAAAANLVLMYFAAIILGESHTQLASDFSFLILTVPAAIAAWIGLDSSGRVLVEGTLTSRLSTLATILVSLVASGLYMAQAVGLLKMNETRFVFLGVHDTAWLILIFSAFLNWSWTTYCWIGRCATFYLLANRRIQSGQETNSAQEGG